MIPDSNKHLYTIVKQEIEKAQYYVKLGGHFCNNEQSFSKPVQIHSEVQENAFRKSESG